MNFSSSLNVGFTFHKSTGAKGHHGCSSYCALTLTVILVWHPTRIPPGGGQWSAKVLAAEMKLNEYGDSSNFTVNLLALHQGFSIFKKSIRSLGHELVQMGGGDEMCP